MEQVGGLPSYIDRIAKHLHYDQGMSISRAIASAVSQVRRWSRGGGDVKADTRAKAAAAVASWESKKARSKAQTAARRRGPGRGRRRGQGPGRSADLSTPPPVWRLDLSTNPFMAPGAVWELAQISSHGWVPNNPVTALKWRKGAWTPPGGSPIKAATIRERLGAKTNKDAIRILEDDPSAMDKVTGKTSSPGKRPVRNRPRRRTTTDTSTDTSTDTGSGSADDPNQRQTLRPNTAPTSGREVDTGEISRQAAATRQANRPAQAPAEVSEDMGRQRIPRGLGANAGPVQSRPVRNRPRRTQGAADEWVPVSPEANQRSREAFNASLRGSPVKGGEATANNPFEVTKRNDGKFYLNNAQTRRRVMGPTTKKAAMAERQRRARTSPGQSQEAPEGHTIRRSPNGREWQIYDPDGNRVPQHRPARTREQARERVEQMLQTRRLMAGERGQTQQQDTTPSSSPSVPTRPVRPRRPASRPLTPTPARTPEGESTPAGRAPEHRPRAEALASARTNATDDQTGYAFLSRRPHDLPNGRQGFDVIDSTERVWNVEYESRPAGRGTNEGVLWVDGDDGTTGAARFQSTSDAPNRRDVSRLVNDIRAGKRRTVRAGRTPQQQARVREQDRRRRETEQRFPGERGKALRQARKNQRQSGGELAVAVNQDTAPRGRTDPNQPVDVELVGSDQNIYQVHADPSTGRYTVTNESGNTAEGTFEGQRLPLGSIVQSITAGGLNASTPRRAQVSDAALRRQEMRDMSPQERTQHIAQLESQARGARGGSNPDSRRPQDEARFQRLAREARDYDNELSRAERQRAEQTPSAPSAPSVPTRPVRPRRPASRPLQPTPAPAPASGATPRRRDTTTPRRQGATTAQSRREQARIARENMPPRQRAIAEAVRTVARIPNLNSQQRQIVRGAIQKFQNDDATGAANQLDRVPMTRGHARGSIKSATDKMRADIREADRAERAAQPDPLAEWERPPTPAEAARAAEWESIRSQMPTDVTGLEQFYRDGGRRLTPTERRRAYNSGPSALPSLSLEQARQGLQAQQRRRREAQEQRERLRQAEAEGRTSRVGPRSAPSKPRVKTVPASGTPKMSAPSKTSVTREAFDAQVTGRVLQGEGTTDSPRVWFDSSAQGGRWIVEARNRSGRVVRAAIMSDEALADDAAEAELKTARPDYTTAREKAVNLAERFARISREQATEERRRRRERDRARRRAEAVESGNTDDGGLFPAPQPVRPRRGDRATPEEFEAGSRVTFTHEGEEIRGQVWGDAPGAGNAWVVSPQGVAYMYNMRSGRVVDVYNPQGGHGRQATGQVARVDRARRERAQGAAGQAPDLSRQGDMIAEYGTTDLERIRAQSRGEPRTEAETRAWRAERRTRRAEYGATSGSRIREIRSGSPMTTAERSQRDSERERANQRQQEQRGESGESDDARFVRANNARGERLQQRDSEGPITASTQLSTRPELTTREHQGATQALKDAVKRGDHATARRIEEFRADPRMVNARNRADQPGYAEYEELASLVRGSNSVDGLVDGLIYRARRADTEGGDRGEALRMLRLAQEVMPEGHAHEQAVRDVRRRLESSRTTRQLLSDDVRTGSFSQAHRRAVENRSQGTGRVQQVNEALADVLFDVSDHAQLFRHVMSHVEDARIDNPRRLPVTRDLLRWLVNSLPTDSAERTRASAALFRLERQIAGNA